LNERASRLLDLANAPIFSARQRFGRFADCVLVRDRVTFADVLDAELGMCAEVPASRGAWSNRVITPPLFIFGHTGVDLRPAAYAPVEEPPVLRARPVPPQPTRSPLTPLEQQALAALNDLGAGLDDGVSSAGLRCAFRRLAHRYHPDRHPGSSRVEQERLSRLFVETTEHYRLLAAALETRATPTRH
jgi:hypothetical protein